MLKITQQCPLSCRSKADSVILYQTLASFFIFLNFVVFYSFHYLTSDCHPLDLTIVFAAHLRQLPTKAVSSHLHCRLWAEIEIIMSIIISTLRQNTFPFSIQKWQRNESRRWGLRECRKDTSQRLSPRPNVGTV